MKLTRILFTLYLISISVNGLAAFNFQPISMDFSDSGTKSGQSFHAVNDTEKKIALQVKIYKRTMDTEGKDVLEEAPGDFFIYPSQMILDPEQQQRIRVQYKGPKVLKNEIAYRIIVDQVPVKFSDKSSGGLQILFRYIGSIYIVPDRFNIEVTITDIKRNNDKLQITVVNTGNTHTILKNCSIIIDSDTKKIRLNPDDIKDLNDTNILAGTKRIIELKWPPGLPFSNLSGNLEFEKLR